MKADWIAVDWGTTNLRIWVMDATGSIISEANSAQGMVGLNPEDFEPILLSHIESWLSDDKVTPVIACGMVGARQGWEEAPYVATPTIPATTGIIAKSKDTRIRMHIICGVKQDDICDIMRGEETQIAGYLSNNPDFCGNLCLPGTHTKWVEITDGQINRFQTVLTGELFSLIANHSVLRHSLGKSADQWSDEHFLESLSSLFSNPQRLTSALFTIRASDILQGATHGESLLSGALLGVELAQTQEFWQVAPITIIGSGKIAKLYQSALQHLGATVQIRDAKDLTIAWLNKFYLELYP